MISHSHKFIFIHMGRTGGSSVERMAGVELTKDPRTRDAGNTDFEDKHKKFQYYYEKYDKNFECYYRFTLIRNPYDRLISAWFWQRKVIGNSNVNLFQFIKKRPKAWGYKSKLALDGMSFCESMKMLDYVGRFERLQSDVAIISKEIGLGSKDFPHVNRTIHRPYWKYYGRDEKMLFEDRFGDDIEYFGYGFGGV